MELSTHTKKLNYLHTKKNILRFFILIMMGVFATCTNTIQQVNGWIKRTKKTATSINYIQ